MPQKDITPIQYQSLNQPQENIPQYNNYEPLDYSKTSGSNYFETNQNGLQITKKKVIEMMPIEYEVEEYNYPKKKSFKKYHAHNDVIEYERQAKMKRKLPVFEKPEEEEEEEEEIYYQPIIKKVKKPSKEYIKSIQLEPDQYRY